MNIEQTFDLEDEFYFIANEKDNSVIVYKATKSGNRYEITWKDQQHADCSMHYNIDDLKKFIISTQFTVISESQATLIML
jgi:hypothetical protein